MRAAIAFSAYGPPRWARGVLANADAAAGLYPGFDVIAYHDGSLTETRPNLRTIQMRHEPGRAGSFWRFLAADLADYTHVLFRDADSLINAREAWAVRQWVADGRQAHNIHDSQAHTLRLAAGMFALRHGAVPSMTALLETWAEREEYGDDERFLNKRVYPLIAHSLLAHSSITWPPEAELLPVWAPAEQIGARCL